jgi:chromate transport protein ChrA
MDRIDLGGLFLHFLILWFVAIGGPSTILPDIHRYLVDVHHCARRTTSCKFTKKLIEQADRSGILEISRLSVS